MTLIMPISFRVCFPQHISVQLGERVFVQQRYERLQERTKKRTKRLSEFQKILEVAEVVERNDEETRGNDGGERNDEETRGNDGGEHEPVGEMNIVHEIDITSADTDEEQTAPIITEEVMDAAAILVQLSGNQEFVKEQETQTDTFVEELMTKVHDLIEKNINSLTISCKIVHFHLRSLKQMII